MPIIFDEVTAEITPPPSAAPAPTPAREAPGGAALDPQELQRELARLAERAARLSAD